MWHSRNRILKCFLLPPSVILANARIQCLFFPSSSFCHSRERGNPASLFLPLFFTKNERIKDTGCPIVVGHDRRAGACGRGCAPVPHILCWGRGLSERSEFRSPHHRDRGKGTQRATPGRQWFWVLLPKQKDLVARGRNPAREKQRHWIPDQVRDDKQGQTTKILDARSGSGMTAGGDPVRAGHWSKEIQEYACLTRADGVQYSRASFPKVTILPLKSIA